MKKVLFLSAIASVVALSSCKKDYTCECTDGSEKESWVYKDVKKKDAKETCQAQEDLYNLFGGGVSCEIK